MKIDFDTLYTRAVELANKGHRPSAKRNAIEAYIEEIIENMRTSTIHIVDKTTALESALNGANDWQHYSQGGMSLCENVQIANLNFPKTAAEYALKRIDDDPLYLLRLQGERLQKAWLAVKSCLYPMFK